MTPLPLAMLLASAVFAAQQPVGTVLHEPLPPAGPGGDAAHADPLGEPPRGADDPALSPLEEGLHVHGTPGDEEGDGVPLLSPPREVALDGRTGEDGILTYYAVFDPSVVPFKRGYARDVVQPDGELAVGDPSLHPALRATDAPRSGHEPFWGSLLVELVQGQPVPIPSVAPDGAIIGFETVPEVPAELLADGADNLYLRSSVTGRIRLNVRLDAPREYFAGSVPQALRLADVPLAQRPTLPPAFAAAAADVFAAVRAASDLPPGPVEELPLGQVLAALTLHFRSFVAEPLVDVPEEPVARYRAIALARRGVCRHRAYGFLVTAQSLGIPTRYVANEAHAFVEVRLPGTAPAWRRIDLGGGAAGFELRGATHRARHTTSDHDPFPAPAGFTAAYSQRMSRPPLARPLPPTTPPLTQRAASVRRGPLAPGPTEALAVLPELFVEHTAPTRRGVSVELDEAASHVFRGQSLALAGRIREYDGPALPDAPVELLLYAPATAEPVALLGETRTGADGSFRVDTRVPDDVPPGPYVLRARFPGTPSHGPAVSP